MFLIPENSGRSVRLTGELPLRITFGRNSWTRPGHGAVELVRMSEGNLGEVFSALARAKLPRSRDPKSADCG